MPSPSYQPETTERHSLYMIVFPNLCVYVGITSDLKKRWRTHRRDAKLGSGLAVHRAMRKYPDAQIVPIESGSREHVARREIELIASIPKSRRYNATDGGDLGVPGYEHSAETRALMSATRKGRKQSPEHVANLAAARRGQTRSAESRARMSEGQKRRVRTPEEIERMRTAAVGRVVTDEHRAKLSAAATARWARARP